MGRRCQMLEAASHKLIHIASACIFSTHKSLGTCVVLDGMQVGRAGFFMGRKGNCPYLGIPFRGHMK